MRAGARWTPQRLAWTAALFAWSEQHELTERFAAVGAFCKKMFPHWKLGSSYDGWVRALAREEKRMLPWILDRLRQAMRERQETMPRQRWQVFAVDGTTVSVPRTRENQQAMGDKGKPDGMPLVALTVLFHLRLGLPWAFRIGPGTDAERTHLLDMLDELPEGQSLLVADAGFVGYEFCRRLMDRGKYFLLRVGGNVHLLTELGLPYEVRGQTVYLWPKRQQMRNEPPVQLRLIVLRTGEREPVYLLTNVLDPEALTDEEASEFYAQRWGEEVFYRTAKQTFEFHRLRSRTPQNCYQELTWAMIGIWLLGLLTTEQLQEVGHDPLEWSAAASRNVVRRVLRNQPPGRRSRQCLVTVLRGCRKDRYERRGPKASRNYPRQRTRRPPGPPKIELANAQQRQRAKQLTPLQSAA